MLSQATKRLIGFAACMALVTGSLASAAGILRNYGIGPQFIELWLRAVSVSGPTIIFSILVVAPRIMQLTERAFPESKEPTHA